MKKIKIGVFGAYRGMTMISILAKYEGAELVAICDRSERMLKRCEDVIKEHSAKITLYRDFEEFFKHDMDAVVLANCASEHAPFAIRLLKSGRHVASEVLPVKNMAEAVALCEAVEESGKVYAYLENYCYFPSTNEMRRLYKEGVFGEFRHGEGEYIHDCENRWDELTYGDKNHWRNMMSPTFYCTHSFGPIVHITGCRPAKVIGIQTPSAQRLIDKGYKGAECAMEIVQMDNGATVKSIHGQLIREPSSVWYSLYGSKAMAESERFGDRELKLSVYNPNDEKPFTSYNPVQPYESELSKEVTSHGGSDFYTIHYFIQKILGNDKDKNCIDVYEALDMSMPGLLAYRSICNGNIPIEVPDMRNKSERQKYRLDTWSTFGEGENKAPLSLDGIEIPDSTYERVKRQYEERCKAAKQ